MEKLGWVGGWRSQGEWVNGEVRVGGWMEELGWVGGWRS